MRSEADNQRDLKLAGSEADNQRDLKLAGSEADNQRIWPDGKRSAPSGD
jgi:hypothetical protein